ncbi:MAG: MBL fold metallo-hydrolase [Clostridia bacterium]|nr:MBL fold metallo-hydrolase [Clostridia bacterium]
MLTTEEMNELRPQMKDKPHLGKMNPFRIIGNTYFCGTYQASCHLIDTGDGLILIDPGYDRTAYLVVNSIYKLGFSVEDIKYIFITHWHGDHSEATDALVALSGAKVIIGREDAERVTKYCTPDILIDDGYVLTLGNTSIRFIHTPGHTKGTMSFFYDVEEDGRTYRVGSFGGAGVNTMKRSTFDFDGAREAYLASLERLRAERVDVFIGNHVWNNDTYGKSVRMLAGGENEFIDGKAWHSFLDGCEERLMKVIESDP